VLASVVPRIPVENERRSFCRGEVEGSLLAVFQASLDASGSTLLSLSSVVVDLDRPSTDQVPLESSYHGIDVLVIIKVDEAIRWVSAGERVDRHVNVDAEESGYTTSGDGILRNSYTTTSSDSNMLSTSSGWTSYKRPPRYNRLAIAILLKVTKGERVGFARLLTRAPKYMCAYTGPHSN
jgi:hypothetical protein